MTATPDLLRAIATQRDALTQAQIDAKTAALNAKVNSFLALVDDPQAALDELQLEIDADAAALATANAANIVAAARETTQAGYIAELNANIASLQEQIAAGAPPATAEDIAERDEVHALLTELGITIPSEAADP